MEGQWLLRDIRKHLRLTQAQLGKRSGLYQVRISQIENGEYEPTSDERKALVQALRRACAVRELEHVLDALGSPEWR